MPSRITLRGVFAVRQLSIFTAIIFGGLILSAIFVSVTEMIGMRNAIFFSQPIGTRQVIKQGQKFRDDDTCVKFSASNIKRSLLIYHVDEQLGKAESHLMRIFSICIKFNFTCVLPRFRNSEMNFEGYDLFSFYYDEQDIMEYWTSDVLSLVSHDCFVRSLQEPWPAVFLNIGRPLKNVKAAERTLGLLNADLRLNNTIYLRSAGWPTNETIQKENERILEASLNGLQMSLVVSYNDYSIPFDLHTNIEHYKLKPSRHIAKMVSEFRDTYKSYIGFQWRTELLPGKYLNFSKCADCALTYLRNASILANTSFVYFGSDSDADGMSYSNSKSTVSLEQARAFTKIMQEYQILTWRNISMPRSPEIDLSVFGILDRSILAGSSILLIGEAGECARGGVFVLRVQEWWHSLAKKNHSRSIRSWSCEQ